MGTVLVENVKILPKGQVTIPRDIRRSLGVDEGDRVTFIQQDDMVIMMNSAIYAMKMLQEAMQGEAERTGLFTEEDAYNLIADLRRESQE